MKTAVSIPNPILRAAEKEARRRRVSRSRLYADALRGLLEARRQVITAAVNRACEGQDTRLDPVLEQMQWASLERDPEPW